MGMAELEAQRAGLKRAEEVLIPGAYNRTPKQQMLDASEVQKQHPDEHIRWVNVRDPQKAETRKMEGYRRLTSEEGGRAIGNELVLMAIPRKQYEARKESEHQLNRERMEAHKTEMRAAAESVAREMRDRHGVHIDADQILVKE